MWILIGETFPTRTRAKQGALSTASNWYAKCLYLLTRAQAPCSLPFRLWNFLLAFFTPFIVKAIEFRYGFVFAGKHPFLLITANFSLGRAACNLLGAAVVYFFLYESSDLSLESVDHVCVPVDDDFLSKF